MRLDCDLQLAAVYKSSTQKARVLCESWCERELYCPACDSERLSRTRTNTRAVDFLCDNCLEAFQLKGGKGWNQPKIVDAGYEAMIAAIRSERAPNLFILQYSPAWNITNFIVVPRFYFTESTVERRRPLSDTARRSGWVGCNILLSAMPQQAKIPIVIASSEVPRDSVREQFRRSQPLRKLGTEVRGWALDVLKYVDEIGKSRFDLADVYAFEGELARLHPGNRNIRAKIRQQLQSLRDLGFLSFEGNGRYALLR